MTGSALRRLGLALGILALPAILWIARPSADRGGEGEEPAAQAARLAADPRLAEYLGPCARSGVFDADTSDMIRVWVGKLESGQAGPVHQAQKELAQLGASSLPELERFLAERFDDPGRGHAVQNALEVLARAEEPWGHDLLLRGLAHPMDTVRLAAVRGLKRHGNRGDYPALLDLLSVSGPEAEPEIVLALHRIDPRRFAADFAGWLERGEHAGSWSAAAALVCQACEPEVRALFADRLPSLPPGLRPALAACSARQGDSAALEWLRGELRVDDPARRLAAAEAADLAGLTAELEVLRSDADPRLRSVALAVLARGDGADLLRAALGDRSPGVRSMVLGALVDRGDEAAVDQVLEMLRGSQSDRESAVTLLRTAWQEDPDLAARALAILTELHAERSGGSPGELAALEIAISRVPSADAARFLYELGRRTPAGARGSRASMSDHRWYVSKAGNTGSAGRRFLAEQWALEPDPERRMDLVEAASYGMDADLRSFLVASVQSDRASDFEELQMAEILVRLGPAGEIAPLLKRAAFGIVDPRARSGIQCLLWEWYGP